MRRAASVALARRRGARLRRRLTAMVERRETIVAGPWLGEVGFELLYWVPFLRWVAEAFALPPERLLVLSRGGTSGWYAPFAGQYAEVFAQVGPEAFRAQHDARVRCHGEQKQRHLMEFERRLLAEATASARIVSWSLLHPSSMYELLDPFWWGHMDGSWVHAHARYRRLYAVPPADLVLPAEPYAAVKFYFNECFPATEGNRAAAHEIVRALARRGPVVVLTSGVQIDDHAGFAVDERGVQHLPTGLTPERNLLVQSAIVANARTFVGTYGGFSYLAPFHGVPSTGVYSRADGFSTRHLTMVRDALATTGGDTLLRVHDISEGTPREL